MKHLIGGDHLFAISGNPRFWGIFLAGVLGQNGLIVCLMRCSQRGATDPTGRKRLHALVCAPSNAAVDNLMKKIIVFFKGKTIDGKIKGINYWNTQRAAFISPHNLCTLDEHWVVCLGNCGAINLVRLGSERTICQDVVQFGLDRQTKSRTGEVFVVVCGEDVLLYLLPTEHNAFQTDMPWLSLNIFLVFV